MAYDQFITCDDKSSPEDIIRKIALKSGNNFAIRLVNVGGGGSAPVASFTTNPDPATGDAPLTEAFTDTSTNTPTSWLWTITGGVVNVDYVYTAGTSTSQNPTIRFDTPGTYGATLKATNAFGNNTSGSTAINANYLAQALAYFNEVPDEYTDTQKAAYNTWLQTVIADGNSPYILRAFRLANGRSKANGYISVVNPASTPAVEILQDSTQIRWIPLGGSKGSTNFNAAINTNFIPNDFPLLANDSFVSWIVTEDGSDGTFQTDWGAADANGANANGTPNLLGNFLGDLFNIDPGVTYANAVVVGWYAMRMVGDLIYGYKNGVQQGAPVSKTFYGLHHIPFYILVDNVNGVMTYGSANRISDWKFGYGGIDIAKLYAADVQLDADLQATNENILVVVEDQSNGSDRNLVSSLTEAYKQPIINARSVYKASYGTEGSFPASLVTFRAGYNSFYAQANAGTYFSYTTSLALQLTNQSKSVIIANASVPGTSMTLGVWGDPSIDGSWNIAETGRNNLGDNAESDFVTTAISLSGWSTYSLWYVMGVKETDALEVGRANVYEANLIARINEIKALHPTAKFVILECPDLDITTFPGRSIIQTAQGNIVGSQANCYLKSKTGIVLDAPTSAHWTDASALQYGLDLGTQILSI
ncbi:MAG: PKD domain-containing protein [Bacteroidota bacterium]